MLQILYIVVFTIVAFITITNLIKNLVLVSFDSGRRRENRQNLSPRHPELFDENGQPTNEPLLVIRSVNVEDVRRQLDKLYQSSSPEDYDS